jgi:hypothetical protein
MHRWAASHTVVPVRADSVATDYFNEQHATWEEARAEVDLVVPAFPRIWIEWVSYEQKIGVAVSCAKPGLDALVQIVVIAETEGNLWDVAHAEFTLNNGRLPVDPPTVRCRTGSSDGAHYASIPFMIGFHTLCRINCRNVRLIQELGPKINPRAKRPPPVPLCTWRTIVVDSVPKFARKSEGSDGPGEATRQFRIKGHYRRWNPHPLKQFQGPFWIPDRWVGDPELGTVLPEYEIK